MGKETDRRPHELTLEEIARAAKDVALRDGGHAPTIIAEGGLESVVGQLPELPGTTKGRVRYLRSVGLTLGQSTDIGPLKRVFFITEGWMSSPQGGIFPDVRPSLDPNRTEVLLVLQMMVNEHQTHGVGFEMIRNADGHLTVLRELSDLNDDGAQADSPLLEAFVTGFQSGRQSRAN